MSLETIASNLAFVGLTTVLDFTGSEACNININLLLIKKIQNKYQLQIVYKKMINGNKIKMRIINKVEKANPSSKLLFIIIITNCAFNFSKSSLG